MNETEDRELELARLLSESVADTPPDPGQFTPEDLAEFDLARKGLAALHALGIVGDVSGDPEPFAVLANPDALCGQHIGRFEIRQVLGVGGHGLVFLAHDPDLDREIALKIPSFNTNSNPELLIRFEREAKAAAILSHPAIVPVFETGKIGNLSYIAYAYCPGTTLAEWTKHGIVPMDSFDAARIIEALSHAIQHAHQRGVSHRDIKPANILIEMERESTDLRPDQMADAVRIADFGLAKVQRADYEQLTQTGDAVGTPAYMSPEQIHGDDSSGTASDIFALGIILYELITGTSPHRRKTHTQTLYSIENEIPPEPRSINRAVPRDLGLICLKCLRKDPADRYASAQALADDLRSFLNYLPISARPESFTSRADKWMTRNRSLVWTGGIGLLAVIVVLVIALVLISAARDEEHRMNQVAQANLSRTRDVVDELLLMASDEFRNVPGGRAIRDKLVHKASKYFEQLLNENEQHSSISTRDMARTRMRMADLYREAGKYDEAEQQYGLAYLEFETLLSSVDTSDEKRELNREVSSLMLARGMAFANVGQHLDAREWIGKAIKSWEQLLEHAPDNQGLMLQLGYSWLTDAEVLTELDLLDEAVRELAIASQLLRAALNESNKIKILQYDAAIEEIRGHASKQSDDLRQAKESFSSALDSYDDLRSRFPASPYYDFLWSNTAISLCQVYRRLGEKEHQAELIESVIETLEQIVAQNPSVSSYVEKLGIALDHKAMLVQRSDPQLAEQLLIRGIQLLEQIDDSEKDPDPIRSFILGASHNNLARARFRTLRYKEAESSLRSAIQFTGRAVEWKPKSFAYRQNLSNHYYGLGDIEKRTDRPLLAIGSLRRAIDIRVGMLHDDSDRANDCVVVITLLRQISELQLSHVDWNSAFSTAKECWKWSWLLCETDQENSQYRSRLRQAGVVMLRAAKASHDQTLIDQAVVKMTVAGEQFVQSIQQSLEK